MFGKKRDPLALGTRVQLSSIRGIDLENGEVIIDGMRYPIDENEVASVAKFCLEIMMRDLQRQIAALAQEYGVAKEPPPAPPKPEEKSADVPAVPQGEAPPTEG